MRGCVGHYHEFAALLVVPQAHAFLCKTMINNINNFGVINFYENSNSNHHSENKQTEDITPVEEDELFCRITKEAYDKGKAQQVEAELRSACVSAPKLVKTIRTNEALGYLDTQNLSSVELYELLNEHYHLPFKPHAFSVARSKRPLDFS